MRSTLLAASLATLTLMGCTQTGKGEYEVDRPVIGTEKDTIIVNKPVIGTVKDTIRTPTVRIGTTEDTIVIKRPTVDVDKP